MHSRGDGATAPAAARYRACVTTDPGRGPSGGRWTGLSVFRESSLHAALKQRYAASMPGARLEAAVDGWVIDVAGPDELVEVQTASFASARRKLERLVRTHRVVLVHPIPLEKWLVRVDADGRTVGRRRSPRRGLELDLFEELVHLAALVAHPALRIELVLTREEEVRAPIPPGVRLRRPRDWRRVDRRLLEVVATRRVDTPADLLLLLPPGLPRPFTTADLVAASGRSPRLAMRATYCLERAGAISRVGRRGRRVAYVPCTGDGGDPSAYCARCSTIQDSAPSQKAGESRSRPSASASRSHASTAISAVSGGTPWSVSRARWAARRAR